MKTTPNNFRLCRAIIALLLAQAALSGYSNASTLYWDPLATGTGASDGSGNVSGTTWSNGSTDTTYTNGNVMTIGVVGSGSGTSYTVTNDETAWALSTGTIAFQGGASYTFAGNNFLFSGIEITSAATGTLTISALGVYSGTCTIANNSSSTGVLNYTGALATVSSSPVTLNFAGTATGTNTIQQINSSTHGVTVKVTGGVWAFNSSGANSYQNITDVAGGKLIVGSSWALANTGTTMVTGGTLSVAGSGAYTHIGSLDVSLGVIDFNGTGVGKIYTGYAGATAGGANGNFTMSGGELDITLGTSYDQIISSATTNFFTITGGTLALDITGSGFDYDSTYTILSGFGSGSVSNLIITGYDTSAYTASLNDSGVLSFEAVPEPGACALTLLGLMGVLAVWRRQDKKSPNGQA